MGKSAQVFLPVHDICHPTYKAYSMSQSSHSCNAVKLTA